MSDISEQNIQFWQRIFNKAFWLGVVGVAALGLNTALEVQKKLKKNKSKKKPSTTESPGTLAGIALLYLLRGLLLKGCFLEPTAFLIGATGGAILGSMSGFGSNSLSFLGSS